MCSACLTPNFQKRKEEEEDEEVLEDEYDTKIRKINLQSLQNGEWQLMSLPPCWTQKTVKNIKSMSNMNCMKSMENMKKDSPDGLSFFDRREYYEASDHLWNL